MLRIAAYTLIVILILVSIGQSLYYWPRLPDQVASHFGVNGKPDGFSSKTTYTWSMLAVNIGVAALLVFIARALKYLPQSMINLPNKDYWLHPNRRASSLLSVELNLLGIAASTICLFIAIAYLMFDANTSDDGMPTRQLGVVIAGYVILTSGHAIWLLHKFSRPGRN